jgi:ATP-dependent DNA ligase
MALRFARIGRIRDDKTPAEADTIQHMRRLCERQSE